MGLFDDAVGAVDEFFDDQVKDFRCHLKAKPGGELHVFGKENPNAESQSFSDQIKNLGSTIAEGAAATVDNFTGEAQKSDILAPLQKDYKVVFPYTPTIQVGGTAEYDEYAFTHSNFKNMAYNRSYPHEITIAGDFTAQNTTEAHYLLAVMHFFKSITKSYFGNVTNNVDPGTPPPILYFNYMGKRAFNNVPVVVTDYAYTLQPDVDYVEVPFLKTKVPTFVNIAVTLSVTQNPRNVRDNFNLDEFRAGKLFDNTGDGFL